MSDLWGVLLGGVLATAGGGVFRVWDEWRQRMSLRRAFHGEISAILEVSEKRGHNELFQEVLKRWAAGENIPVFLFGMDEMPSDPIFEANAGKIGSLGGDVSKDVASFYMGLKAVRICVVALRKGQMDALPLHAKSAIFQQTFEIWQQTQETGRRLTVHLPKCAFLNV